MCPDKENKPTASQNGTGPKSGILNQNDSPRGSKDPGSANSINDWGGSEMDFEGMKSKPMILKADSLKVKIYDCFVISLNSFFFIRSHEKLIDIERSISLFFSM